MRSFIHLIQAKGALPVWDKIVAPLFFHSCPAYASSRHVFGRDPVSFFRSKDAGCQPALTAVRNNYVMPAEAGIQCLKSLDSSQKHAGMTVSERLFEFKSIFSLTMSKTVWYARMRHVRDYYYGQQCANVGMTENKDAMRYINV